MLRIALALTASLGCATLARAQTSPIRTGTYDLEIVFGGGTLEATLVLTRTGDSLTARLNVGDHVSPVSLTQEEGSRLVLAGGPGIQVRYELTFDGDNVTGTFIYDGQAGSLTGKRRRGRS